MKIVNNKLIYALIILAQIFVFNIAYSASNTKAVVDTLPPTKPIVLDDGDYLVSESRLHAYWISAGPESEIIDNQYSIGTSPGATDIVEWTSVGKDTEVTRTDLVLTHNKAYYFNVKTKNGVNLWSEVGSSDGIVFNAHNPLINSITPQDNSTFFTKTAVNIVVNARDSDDDPLEYRFLVDDKVGQDWSTSSSFIWTALPTTTLTRKITCQVRDNKKGEVSQNVNYNIEIDINDTTPPTTPIVTTDEYSNSLDSLHASWTAEDPESGISEFQYAIGTFPGGRDVVDWTSAGTNTEITHYGLNLVEGQGYYFSVRAINGAKVKNSEQPVDLKLEAFSAQAMNKIKNADFNNLFNDLYIPKENTAKDTENDKEAIVSGLRELIQNKLGMPKDFSNINSVAENALTISMATGSPQTTGKIPSTNLFYKVTFPKFGHGYIAIGVYSGSDKLYIKDITIELPISNPKSGEIVKTFEIFMMDIAAKQQKSK
ncbi:MAG: fibronectin type III domain-containing protein [Candidatus Omnitrophota bacterium]|jgi:hypothetical protein